MFVVQFPFSNIVSLSIKVFFSFETNFIASASLISVPRRRRIYICSTVVICLFVFFSCHSGRTELPCRGWWIQWQETPVTHPGLQSSTRPPRNFWPWIGHRSVTMVIVDNTLLLLINYWYKIKFLDFHLMSVENAKPLLKYDTLKNGLENFIFRS